MNTTTNEPAIAPRKIQLRDRNGQPVLDYDTDSGVAVLHLPEAVIRIQSVDGRVELTSNRDIRLHSARTVEIAGDRGIRLEGEGASLLLKKKSELKVPSLQVDVSRLAYEGERISGHAREAVFTWGRLRQNVDRFLQFAKTAYVRVESVLHTRAGRIRTETEGTYHLRADEVKVLAKRDVRLDGRTINLG